MPNIGKLTANFLATRDSASSSEYRTKSSQDAQQIRTGSRKGGVWRPRGPGTATGFAVTQRHNAAHARLGALDQPVRHRCSPRRPVVCQASEESLSLAEETAAPKPSIQPIKLQPPRFTVHECIESEVGWGRYQYRMVPIMLWTFLLAAMHAMMTVFVDTQAAVGAQWAVSEVALGGVKSLFFVGCMFGAFLSGPASDKLGRLRAWLWGYCAWQAAFLLTAVAPSFEAYSVLRFLVGFGQQFVSCAAFGLAAEACSEKYRPAISISFNWVFALGVMVISGVAWAGEHLLHLSWQQLTLGVGAMGLSILPLTPLLLESPRWLLSKGRGREARQVLEKMADVNGAQMPRGTMEGGEEAGSSPAKGAEREPAPRSYSVVDLFSRSSKYRRTTFGIIILWLNSSAVYYGLSLNVSALAGSVYVNLALLALSEVPGYYIGGVLSGMARFGRKGAQVLCFATSALCCLLNAALIYARGCEWGGCVPAWGTTVVGMVGNGAVSGAFGGLFMYTSELYPTAVRSTAIGFGSACARFGAAMAPQVVVLSVFGECVPALAFFALALGGVVYAVYGLEETYGRPLPEGFEGEGEGGAALEPSNQELVGVCVHEPCPNGICVFCNKPIQAIESYRKS